MNKQEEIFTATIKKSCKAMKRELIKTKLKNCPWCRVGKARPADKAPWDEYGYTCCTNPHCISVSKDGEAQRLPIVLWENLLRRKR